MTDLEAIEYRVANNHASTLQTLDLVFFGLATVVIVLADSVLAAIGGGVLFLFGIYFDTAWIAVRKHGFWRRLYGHAIKIDNPPLDQWEASLKARDAFGGESWDEAEFNPTDVESYTGDD